MAQSNAITDHEITLAAKMLANGHTYDEIAERTRRSQSHLLKRTLDRYPHLRKRPTTGHHADDMKAKIVAMRGTKASIVGRKFGMTTNAILGIWHRHKQKLAKGT